jgi:hypothetical protein
MLVVVVEAVVTPGVDGPPQAARSKPATASTAVSARLPPCRIGRRRDPRAPALPPPSKSSPNLFVGPIAHPPEAGTGSRFERPGPSGVRVNARPPNQCEWPGQVPAGQERWERRASHAAVLHLAR